MPKTPLPALADLKFQARWLGQGGKSTTGHGNVAVAIEGLPANQRIEAAALSDSARGSWVYRGSDRITFDADPFPQSMALHRASNSTKAELEFPPDRSEAGATMTLRVLFQDGKTTVTQFEGGPCDLGKRASGIAPGTIVARPGDDLHKLVGRAGTVKLVRGTFELRRPLVLERSVKITAEPGTTLRFAQGPSDPPWTTAIKIHSSHTTLEGFAVRFATPIRWVSDVSYGPAVIGTTDNLDQGIHDPKVDISLTRLDLEAPPASHPGTWEESPRLARLVSAACGRVDNNILKGGTIEFVKGPWQVVDNEHRGTPASTFTPTVFSGHHTYDLVLKGNRARAVEPYGKTWRFLVLSQSGAGDLIEDNKVEGVGPRDNDTIPSMNAPEVMLTEAYRLHFEGKPSAVSSDGRMLRIPRPQGDPAQTGDVVAILSGPQAGEWRRIAQAMGPTTYLVDPPLPQGDYAISIATGFVRETFRGNTIESRGGSQAANLVLVGNHYGTKVVGNHLIGGGEAFRITAAPTEQPVFWGWSHAPFLGGVIEENSIEDSLRGGRLCVEHGKPIKTNRGRVYMNVSLKNNTAQWTEALFSDRSHKPAEGALQAWTIGERGALDPGEMIVEEQGNRAKVAPGHRRGAKMQVEGAVVNGRVVRDRALPLPAASSSVSRGPDGSGAGAPLPKR